jgi:hypothetical protein
MRKIKLLGYKGKGMRWFGGLLGGEADFSAALLTKA